MKNVDDSKPSDSSCKNYGTNRRQSFRQMLRDDLANHDKKQSYRRNSELISTRIRRINTLGNDQVPHVQYNYARFNERMKVPTLKNRANDQTTKESVDKVSSSSLGRKKQSAARVKQPEIHNSYKSSKKESSFQRTQNSGNLSDYLPDNVNIQLQKPYAIQQENRKSGSNDDNSQMEFDDIHEFQLEQLDFVVKYIMQEIPATDHELKKIIEDIREEALQLITSKVTQEKDQQDDIASIREFLKKGMDKKLLEYYSKQSQLNKQEFSLVNQPRSEEYLTYWKENYWKLNPFNDQNLRNHGSKIGYKINHCVYETNPQKFDVIGATHGLNEKFYTVQKFSEQIDICRILNGIEKIKRIECLEKANQTQDQRLLEEQKKSLKSLAKKNNQASSSGKTLKYSHENKSTVRNSIRKRRQDNDRVEGEAVQGFSKVDDNLCSMQKFADSEGIVNKNAEINENLMGGRWKNIFLRNRFKDVNVKKMASLEINDQLQNGQENNNEIIFDETKDDCNIQCLDMPPLSNSTLSQISKKKSPKSPYFNCSMGVISPMGKRKNRGFLSKLIPAFDFNNNPEALCLTKMVNKQYPTPNNISNQSFLGSQINSKFNNSRMLSNHNGIQMEKSKTNNFHQQASQKSNFDNQSPKPSKYQNQIRKASSFDNKNILDSKTIPEEDQDLIVEENREIHLNLANTDNYRFSPPAASKLVRKLSLKKAEELDKQKRNQQLNKILNINGRNKRHISIGEDHKMPKPKDYQSIKELLNSKSKSLIKNSSKETNLKLNKNKNKRFENTTWNFSADKKNSIIKSSRLADDAIEGVDFIPTSRSINRT